MKSRVMASNNNEESNAVDNIAISIISGAEAEKISESNLKGNGNCLNVEGWSKNFKLFLCFIGLQLSYVTWG